MSKKERTMIYLTVEYPEGCMNKQVKFSRKTRYFPRNLSMNEVMILEGNDGSPFFEIYRLFEDWRGRLRI